MESKNDGAARKDISRRKRSGWFIGAIAFLVAYAIFVLSYDHWGLALGWVPSTIIAAAFGRIGYCFPWIIDVLAILFDVLGLICAHIG